ncbi:DUF1810 domain-containing protein [Hansschlegelia quercus]|uniref:DUF1810 domain-containing protein n=1 Tax=Hansschlegelia quercus TaxID=2528245 RepID=A0A4Q9GIB0_9HYPH|nr:DUF1810 domain-containing protein [Hansschlegelia quercus]TBN53933.1 DUF1810 domain-containing protein [Hansschlegelia quercus]
MPHDPHRLERFMEAQRPVFEAALGELKAGRKRSHWMWFVFPQLRGLGSSGMADFYGIASLAEARAYLAHPVLGRRLRAATEAVLAIEGADLRTVFGSPDDMKFRSSMTLFEGAADGDETFGQALERLCGGVRDDRTLALLEQS